MTSRDNLTSMGSVTNLTPVGPADTDVVHGAVVAADAAALAAGVSVREVTDLAELADVVALYATIWGRSENPPLTLELLRAFTKAGNYVGGAFEGGRLVGACVGFFHAPAEDALHSHIAGVDPRAERAARRVRAQAAPARVGDAARRLRDRLDLRPAGQPQRLLQRGEAGRPPGRVPHELLRPDARHHQRRRRLRPAAGALAAAGPRGRRGVRRPVRTRRWSPTRSPPAPSSRSASGPTAHRSRASWTARPRWSPYPVTSVRCATSTPPSPSAGGSRCGSR